MLVSRSHVLTEQHVKIISTVTYAYVQQGSVELTVKMVCAFLRLRLNIDEYQSNCVLLVIHICKKYKLHFSMCSTASSQSFYHFSMCSTASSQSFYHFSMCSTASSQSFYHFSMCSTASSQSFYQTITLLSGSI